MYYAASAAPSPAGQAYAPQGFGDFLSGIAPVLQTLAPIALSLLEAQPQAAGASPYGAAPQPMSVSPYGVAPFAAGPLAAQASAYSPQGFFGDLIGSIAQPIGSAIGGWAGNQQMGSQIGNIAGQAAKNWLPFSVAPTPAFAGQPAYGWGPGAYGSNLQIG
jgi:hypothetical protein